MFSSMFIIVGAMLCMLRMNYTLTPKKGIILLGLYALYLVSFFYLLSSTAQLDSKFIHAILLNAIVLSQSYNIDKVGETIRFIKQYSEIIYS